VLPAVTLRVANRAATLLSASVANSDCADAETHRARAGAVLRTLAAHPAVHWIERRAEVKPLNKFAAAVVQTDRAGDHAFWRRGIFGKGQTVAVADTGVDHDSCFFHDPARAVPFNKFDPKHRKIVAYHTSAEITPRDLIGGDQVDGHGTHTSGTVAGEPHAEAGAGSAAEAAALGDYRGIVFKAKLAIFDYQHPSAQPDEMVLPDDVYSDYLARARNDYGVHVTSNSWGDQAGLYDSFARAIDQFAWDYPDFLNFFAAGNTGTLGRLTIASPALCKNVIAVGSSLNSPVSFKERGIDGGLRLTTVPPLARDRLPSEVGVVPAAFGIRFPAMPAVMDIPLINAVPADACGPLTNDPASLRGAAVLVMRGTCRFTQKAAAAQAAGAALLVVVNDDANEAAEPMFATASDRGAPRPSEYSDIAAVMVERDPGLVLIAHAGTRVGSNNATEGIRVSGPVPFVMSGHHEFRLSSFSSRGPTKDGRLKPDLVAPGEYIISARSDGDLSSFQCSTRDGSTLKAMQGTSMAAPVAASAAVVVREYLMKGYYPTGNETAPLGVFELTPRARRAEDSDAAERTVNGELTAASTDAFKPSAALVKALLVHSAVAVGGPVKSVLSDTGFEDVPPPPSVYQGHGRIKLDNVLTFADDAAAGLPQPSVFILDHKEGLVEARDRWHGGPTASAAANTGDTHLYCFDASEVVRNAVAFARAGRSPFAPERGTSVNTTAEHFPFAFSEWADPYIRATLAYTDFPASLASAHFLVNDLDLTAVVTGVPTASPPSPASLAAEPAATRGRVLARMYVGNQGADYTGAGAPGRVVTDISRIYDDTNIGTSFYERVTSAAAGAAPGSFSILSPEEPVRWDHANNLEALTVTTPDILSLLSGSAAPTRVPASGVEAVAANRDWLLSVLVHGTAVPHGPQPFALVVSTLHGGQIQARRLPAGRCAAATAAVATPPRAAAVQPPVSLPASAPVPAGFATASLCPRACSGRGQCLSSLNLAAADPTALTNAAARLSSASAGWGCVCDGTWAGPDCSQQARPVTAVPASVSVADALALGRATTSTLAPGRYDYYYVYVPPLLRRTDVPDPGTADYTEDGLVLSMVRLSDAGDADYYVLTPPSTTYDTAGAGRARVRVSALASPLHAVAHGGWPSEIYYSYANTQCDNCFDDLLAEAVDSFVERQLINELRRGNAPATGVGNGTNAGATAGTAATAAAPKIRVSQFVLVPHAHLPPEGGYFKVAVHAPCCDNITYALMASMPGATLNVHADGAAASDADKIAALSTEAHALALLADATAAAAALAAAPLAPRVGPPQPPARFTPPPAAPVPSTLPAFPSSAAAAPAPELLSAAELAALDSAGGPVATVLSARAPALERRLLAAVPSAADGIVTSVRLGIDMRALPTYFSRLFQEEMSSLLGIDDGPCRVTVLRTERIPATMPLPAVPNLDLFSADDGSAPNEPAARFTTASAPGLLPPAAAAELEARLTRRLAVMSASETSSGAVGHSFAPLQSGGPARRVLITFALLPPPSGAAMRVAASASTGATAGALAAALPQTCALAVPKFVSPRSVTGLYLMLSNAFELAQPSSSFSIFSAQAAPSRQPSSGSFRARTLSLPSMLPFSSLILTQVDVLHRPPHAVTATRLCRDGAYRTECAEIFDRAAALAALTAREEAVAGAAGAAGTPDSTVAVPVSVHPSTPVVPNVPVPGPDAIAASSREPGAGDSHRDSTMPVSEPDSTAAPVPAPTPTPMPADETTPTATPGPAEGVAPVTAPERQGELLRRSPQWERIAGVRGALQSLTGMQILMIAIAAAALVALAAAVIVRTFCRRHSDDDGETSSNGGARGDADLDDDDINGLPVGYERPGMTVPAAASEDGTMELPELARQGHRV
jgi:hypothetical protein